MACSRIELYFIPASVAAFGLVYIMDLVWLNMSNPITKQGSLTAFPFRVLRFNATLPQNNPLQSRSCLRRYVSINLKKEPQ
jgi:hypothetical protein